LKRLKFIRREGRREATVAKEMCEGEREIMEAPDTKLMSSFFFFFFFAARFYTHPCFFATPIYHFVAMSLFLYSKLLEPPHNVDDTKFAAETESQREKRTHANTPHAAVV